MAQEESRKRIKHYRTSGSTSTPSYENLEYGELAIRYADGNEAIFIKNTNNNIVEVGSSSFAKYVMWDFPLTDEMLEDNFTNVGYEWTGHTINELVDIIDGKSVFKIRVFASNGTDYVLTPNASYKDLGYGQSAILLSTQFDLTLPLDNPTEPTKKTFEILAFRALFRDKIICYVTSNTKKWSVDVDDEPIEGSLNPITSNYAYQNRLVVNAALDDLNDRKLDVSAFSASMESYYTKDVIDDISLVTSAALNDLNYRKLDSSAYTPTDLSNYYNKQETDEKIAESTSGKVDTTTFNAHSGNTSMHTTAADRELWNSVSQKLDASAYTPTDLSNYYTKGEVDNAILPFFDDVAYVDADKKIYFYHNESVVGEINAEKFIKDGMINTVSVGKPTSGTHQGIDCLIITFNTDAGKEEIDIPISDIFDADNYYDKSAIDRQMAAKVDNTTFGQIVDTLDRNKLDVSAYTPSDLSNYYNKQETEGKIAESTSGKVDTTTFNAHSGNTSMHTTAADRELWNSVSQKLDVSAFSASMESYYTKEDINRQMAAKVDNTTFGQIVDTLDRNKLDVSAYTPTDLSNYYNKQETNEEITQAISGKVDTTTFNAHSGNTSMHTTAADRELWNSVSDKLDASAYTPTDLSDYYKKQETDEKIVEATSGKADISSLTAYATTMEYIGGSTQKIYLKNGNTVLAEINASDFIKDGMVDTVSITSVTSGASVVDVLQITFNTDSGKQPINIPLSDLFDASKYYDKDDIDSQMSGKTDTATFNMHSGNTNMHITDAERELWNSVSDKLDVSAFSASMESYYTKEEIDDTELVIASALNYLNDRVESLSSNTKDEIDIVSKKVDLYGVVKTGYGEKGGSGKVLFADTDNDINVRLLTESPINLKFGEEFSFANGINPIKYVYRERVPLNESESYIATITIGGSSYNVAAAYYGIPEKFVMIEPNMENKLDATTFEEYYLNTDFKDKHTHNGYYIGCESGETLTETFTTFYSNAFASSEEVQCSVYSTIVRSDMGFGTISSGEWPNNDTTTYYFLTHMRDFLDNKLSVMANQVINVSISQIIYNLQSVVGLMLLALDSNGENVTKVLKISNSNSISYSFDEDTKIMVTILSKGPNHQTELASLDNNENARIEIRLYDTLQSLARKVYNS